MRNLIILFISLGVILCLAVACVNEAPDSMTTDERIAADYVEAQGYKIVGYLGKAEDYVLEREKLLQPPLMNIWSVQNVEPAQYYGETISSYGFVVSTHPLGQLYAAQAKKAEYEFHLYIMLSAGEVIGGYSYPVKKDGALLMGGVYSIDGKSPEEITGLTYVEWLDQWKTKYRELEDK